LTVRFKIITFEVDPATISQKRELLISRNPMMEYNSSRNALIIPEYGRNIQNMVRHATELEDRDERNTCAQAIIKVMGQLNPHLRDVEEYKPKLWAHLFIMSHFKLDVDSPFEKPTPETFQEKPKPVPYPGQRIRYKHFGRTTEILIKKARELEEGEDKISFTWHIANMMKRHYITFNRDSIEDHVIWDNLTKMSEGELKVENPLPLVAPSEVLKGISSSSSSKKAAASPRLKQRKNAWRPGKN